MPDNRAFVGEVDPVAGARLWYLDGTGVRQPVDHVVRHSPDGLSWGYPGNGPADAALSLLTAATGNPETAERLHQAFMRDVLAKLAVNERFALPADHVEAWLAANGAEIGPSRRRPAPGAGADGQDQGEDLDRRWAALADRSRALEERERRLFEQEVRVDAMAVTVGLLPEVEPATWLPAEPLRRHLEALAVDSGDDVAVVARANGLDPPPYDTLVRFAAYTGLRAGEIGALRVKRIDFLRGRVEVAESVSDVAGRLVVGPTKTYANRHVPLPAPLRDELAACLAKRGNQREDLVFTGPQGGPLRHGNFYRAKFKPAVRAAGLPESLRFHDLRPHVRGLLHRLDRRSVRSDASDGSLLDHGDG